MVVFLCLVVSVLVGTHYYIWARLVRDTGLPPPWRRTLAVVLVAFAASFVAGMLAARVMPLQMARITAWPVFTWMGIGFLLVLLLLGVDLLRALLKLSSSVGLIATIDPDRRQFLARVFGGAVTLAASGIATRSLWSAIDASSVAIKRTTVALARLPRKYDGLRIVHLTDLHIGPLLTGHWLAAIVKRVNALKPDLVAITGDLVDGSVDQLKREIAVLTELRSTYGTFFCTGNHEYYSGAPQWCTTLANMGIRVLRNERVPIGDGDTVAFDLAGIDDYNAHNMAPGHGPDLQRALENRDTGRAVILLAHQPRAIFGAAASDVDLQLSGHTHGGQIWPMHAAVRLQQPYLSGLIQHETTKLYISEGTGFWGPPMRIGTTAEIAEITLRAAG